MAQAFLTYDEQLDKLQTEKELSIPDLSYAKNILQQISYYSLIDGYKELFKPLRSGKYYYGVTFEEIYAFYLFDEELRSLFLKYILKVEQHMKSMVSYHFSEKYGENQAGYLTDTNYNLNRKNSAQIQRLVNSLAKSIATPSQYKYINHHANTYGNVPLWVATNALTFGQISKMYQYATSDIRTKISKNYDNIVDTIVKTSDKVIAYKDQMKTKIEASMKDGAESLKNTLNDQINGIFGTSNGASTDSTGISSLLSFSYSDYLRLFLMIGLYTNEEGILLRTGDVIQANMSKKTGNTNYRLANSAAYVEISATIQVKPTLLALPLFADIDGNPSTNQNWYTFEYKSIKGY